MSLLRQLQGSALIASHLHERQVPFWDRARIERRRDARVRRIVRHAARRVPYYRELFAAQSIDPREIRTIDDLRALPVLDRAEVRREPLRFVSDNAATTLPQRTSGSTGTPMEVQHDRGSVLANIAYGEREREAVLRVVGAGFRPRELYIGFEGSNFLKVLAFTAANARLPVRPRRRAIAMTEPVVDIIAAINEYEPHIVTTYGSFADELFRRIRAERLDVKLPKVLMYVGETLPSDRRRAIEEEFGLAVLSRYCAVEAFKIAFYCEERTGFHVHEDLCDVRIQRRDGSAASIGETGEIVLSNLVNRATVLLNYPMGDLGAVSGESCPCGRNLQLLSQIEGRAEDLIPRPSGQVLHPRAIWTVFKEDHDVLQYQLVQTGLQRFELRLATADEDAFNRASGRAAGSMRALLGADIELAIRRDPELGRAERTHRGKFRAVLSQVSASGASR